MLVDNAIIIWFAFWFAVLIAFICATNPSWQILLSMPIGATLATLCISAAFVGTYGKTMIRNMPQGF